MCPVHQREATSVINRRFARANASNLDGWAAINDASLRIDRPHLPDGLAARLPDADASPYEVPDAEELRERADAVAAAAAWFRGRPDDFAMALGKEPDMAPLWPDWLMNLVLDLGRAGLGAEAKRVGDALGEVDLDRQAYFHSDACVALAEAGLADGARDRIAAALARWPDELWVRVHAGDALAALRDRAGAEEHFRVAMEMADAIDDFEAAAEVADRIISLTQPERRARSAGQRRQTKRKLSKAQRKRQGQRKRRK